MNVSRRGFLASASLALGSAALAATGCSPKSSSDAKANASSEAQYAVADFKADETIDADAVVVGAGMSGTVAAKQLSDLGKNVVVFEAGPAIGGNGANTEGVCAVDSTMAKSLGIHVDSDEIVHDELEFFNYRVNAMFWVDALKNSGDNVDWLIDGGAKFTGEVDHYPTGGGKVPTFHWFENHRGESVIKPLMEAAQQAGTQLFVSTRAEKLIMQDGKVAGIVAEKSDGSTLRVNCSDVILASGGYAANRDLMVERGCPTTYYSKSIDTNCGDGLLMARDAGGVDKATNSTFLFSVTIPAIPSFQDGYVLQTLGQVLLVNDRGERFTDESCGSRHIGCYLNTIALQDKTYMILTPSVLNAIGELFPNLPNVIKSACGDTSVEVNATTSAFDGAGMLIGDDDSSTDSCMAKSISELAEKLGIESSALSDTIQRYNELCAGGKDLDFGKEASSMVELTDEGSYYALRVYPGYATSIGAIKTSRNYQVVDKMNKPVDGLYAVGVDGNMMYCETYTIEVPGSANMGNINSARTAAKHIAENRK